MTEKKYQWQLDRAAALSVFLGNVILYVYLAIRLMTDDYFLLGQIGWQVYLPPMIRFIGIILGLGMLVYLNLGFLNRNAGIRMSLALIQSVVLVVILKNLFVHFLYPGRGLVPLVIHLTALTLESYILYMTLFSRTIASYFDRAKKES